jgi:PAS domain S-box-containing protein
MGVLHRKDPGDVLLAAEHRFQSLVENAWDGIALFAADGTILYVSPSASRILGYDVSELTGRRAQELIHPSYLEVSQRRLSDCAGRTGEPLAVELRCRHKDGTWVWLDSVRVNRLDDPDVMGIVCNFRDVTARKRAEEALRLRDRALESLAQGVVITDATRPGTPIIYANPAFEAMTGYAAEEAFGRNPRFLQGPETDPEARRRLREAVSAGTPVSVEILNYRKDGTSFWNEVAISPLRDESGKLTHFVGVKTDVSARREVEEQFRQAQKMEALGRLAGGVAHDFNNILGIIVGCSELLRRKIDADHPGRRCVEQISQAAERAAALTQQLLAFSRRQVVQPRVLDLNGVVAETESMLRRLIGEDVELVTVLGADPGRVKADSTQIAQVLLNLSVNARDAMPDGGTLTIETRRVELGHGGADAPAGVATGPHVLLSVTDSGCGMDADTLGHIFEPFFTTKEEGKGTGLGLATVLGIVKQNGGHVVVESERGQGSVFKIYLPSVAPKPEAVGGAAAARTSARGGSETVLLVEDDAQLRAILRELLVDAGYSVLEAEGPQEALTLGLSLVSPAQLVLTDVVMPRLSGCALAEQLAAVSPGTKVLYMSGHTDDAFALHGLLARGAHLILKPFTAEELLRKVRDLLDSTPSS